MSKHHGVNQATAVSATSSHSLDTSRDGDSSICLGSSFQCLIALPVKKFFLMAVLHIPWQLKTLVQSLVVWAKRPTLPQAPLRDTVIMSPAFVQAELPSSLSLPWCSRPFPSSSPSSGLAPAPPWPSEPRCQSRSRLWSGQGQPGGRRRPPHVGPGHELRLRGRFSPALFPVLSEHASRPGLRCGSPVLSLGEGSVGGGSIAHRAGSTQRVSNPRTRRNGAGAAAPPRAVHCGRRTDLCRAAERAGSGGRRRRRRAGPAAAGPRRRLRGCGRAALLPLPEAVVAPPGGRHHPPGLSRPRARHHGRGGGSGRSWARPEGTVRARRSRRRSVGAGARAGSLCGARAGRAPGAAGASCGERARRGGRPGPVLPRRAGERESRPRVCRPSFVSRARGGEPERRHRAGAPGAVASFLLRASSAGLVPREQQVSLPARFPKRRQRLALGIINV